MIKLRLRRERFQKNTQATTQISSIIRLRNGCGWPFNLVGCSKVAHLESKKKSTQKTSFHHFSGINTAPNQLFSRIRVKETHFFIFFFICSLVVFSPYMATNLLCVIHRSRNFIYFFIFVFMVNFLSLKFVFH